MIESICPNCKGRLASDDTYCQNCGRLVRASEQRQPNAHPSLPKTVPGDAPRAVARLRQSERAQSYVERHATPKSAPSFAAMMCGRDRSIFAVLFNRQTNGSLIVVGVQDDAGLATAPMAKNEDFSHIDWSGFGGCPKCENRMLVQCGACRRLMCGAAISPRGAGHRYVCGWCAAEGPVEGTIKNLLVGNK